MNTARTAATTARRAIALATAVAAATVGGLAAPAAASAEPAPAPGGSALLAPYYTELDRTGDRQVTPADLAVLADAIGIDETDAAWPGVARLDLDADGAIDATDLALMSRRIVYDDGPFQIVEAGLVEMQAAMNAGVLTSVELTRRYIDRIDAYDRVAQGAGQRPLNSIVTTGRDTALAAAAAADAIRSERGMTSMLLGVPVAVKDNYNTVDMPTTAGCGCWDANRTTDDARMIEGLRADGAVILAKASMDEFAVNLSSTFSAFQPAGSTLDVSSPYATTRNAGGSSGGTGAAIAANLAAVGLGTDTGGSIRVPSHYNQLVGVRPTVGLTSRDGIVPLALSQDTGGPMARSVTDAALTLDAVVGIDPADAITARQSGLVPESYTSYLDDDALDEAVIGYLPQMFGPDAGTLALWERTKERLAALGATVVEVTPPAELDAVFREGSGSGPEFNHDLQRYIDAFLDPDVSVRSLAAISASPNILPNRGTAAADLAGATYVTRARVTEAEYQAWAGPQGSHTLQLARGKALLTAMMDGLGLDTIVYPTGTPYGTLGAFGGGTMRLSPNTGLPAVTVPMGQLPGTTDNASNVNLEFLGRDFGEGPLLGLAYAFEQATHARTSPALYPALPAD